jgi:hypothetical protein
MKKILIIIGVIVLPLVSLVAVAVMFKFNFASDSTSVKSGARYFGNEVKGDFNGDDKEDVAYLFTEDGGGSGTFYYVTAKLADGKGFKELDAILLGDRIAPQTTEFKDGMIIVNYADRRPGEPMTNKPSVGMSSYFQVVNNSLVKVK